MKREKMFREFPGCPKANRWDKVGMVIMLISFAGIVVATIGSIIRLPAQFNGPLIFIATYIGVMGYLCTAHASNIYVKFVREKWGTGNEDQGRKKHQK